MLLLKRSPIHMKFSTTDDCLIIEVTTWAADRFHCIHKIYKIKSIQRYFL